MADAAYAGVTYRRPHLLVLASTCPRRDGIGESVSGRAGLGIFHAFAGAQGAGQAIAAAIDDMLREAGRVEAGRLALWI